MPAVFVGQTRSRKLIARLIELGYGEMTVRGELPPRRTPYAFDNGAFRDWREGVPFDPVKYRLDVEKIRSGQVEKPCWMVVPDIVAGGLESLTYSLSWLEELEGVAPLYLAVQDGMEIDDVRPFWHLFDGIFIGGSRPWKLINGESWLAFAREVRLPCHIGRCGGSKTAAWARRIGCDSIDSCLPLFSKENLQRFVDALDEPAQRELF